MTYNVKTLNLATTTITLRTPQGKHYYCLNRTDHNWMINKVGITYNWKTHKKRKEPDTNWTKISGAAYDDVRGMKRVNIYLKLYNNKYHDSGVKSPIFLQRMANCTKEFVRTPLHKAFQ